MSDSIPTKICTKCQETKPVSEFHKNKSTKDGLHSICKPCASKRNKYYRENLEEFIKSKKRRNELKQKKLTQDRLKEVVHYDPDSGIFTNLISRCQNCRKGHIAGSINDKSYNYLQIDGKKYNASRLAFLYMEGYFPEHSVDHINRKRNDNRWVNLRHITQRCNAINTGLQKHNTSGIKGICWNKDCKKWDAHITINKKTIHFGVSKKLDDAVKKRWDAEVKYGFPNCLTNSTAYLYLKSRGLV